MPRVTKLRDHSHSYYLDRHLSDCQVTRGSDKDKKRSGDFPTLHIFETFDQNQLIRKRISPVLDHCKINNINYMSSSMELEGIEAIRGIAQHRGRAAIVDIVSGRPRLKHRPTAV